MKKLIMAAAAAATLAIAALSPAPASAAVATDTTVKSEISQVLAAKPQAKKGTVEVAGRRWRRWHRWHRWNRWGGYRHWRRCFMRRFWTPYGFRFRRVCYY